MNPEAKAMRKLKFLTGIFLLSFVCVLFVSCPWEVSFDQKTFDAQRQLWDKQGLRDYSFYLDYNSDENGYWKGTLAIKDGAFFGAVTDNFLPDSMRFVDLDGPFKNVLLWECISPIPEMYENIRSKSLKTSFSIEIEYNEIYHFPEYVHISYTPIQLIPAPGSGYSYSISITRFTPNPEIEPNILVFDQETFDAERQLWQEQSLRLWQEQGIKDYSFRLGYRYDNRSVWEGTVDVRPRINEFTGMLSYYYASSYTSNDNINNLGVWRWLFPISVIYDRILHDGQANPGLEWGCTSRTTLEVEYSGEYYFPTRYRYYAEPVEPSDQGETYRLYEITISDFTLLEPEK
jgi:hypothetical protein